MRMLLVIMAVLGLTFICSPAIVQAQFDPLAPACNGNGANSPLCKDRNKDPISGQDNIFIKVAQIIVWITGIAAVLMIIIGGFAYVTSSGDPQRLKGAKDSILYAVIGLVVAISAQALISFVLNRVG